MKHVRWYDKTPELSEVFEFIQQLSPEVQNKIAQDVLQVLIKDFLPDINAQINKINKECNYDFKRWYDKDFNLFSSFELIKNLPENLQKQIVKKLVESIYLVCIDETK